MLDEIHDAGIEDVAVVISPGDQAAFEEGLGADGLRVTYVEQAEPLGFGHAVWSAREFTAADPFLLLVSDHLYVSGSETGCAKQLVEIAEAEDCAVSGVQSTHESSLPNYGAVGGRLEPGRRGLYEIAEVMEKPSPTQAEQSLMVPGLRAGHYLCYFGMHVLTPRVMDLLSEQVYKIRESGGVHLSQALRQLADRERYLAAGIDGRRYDIGQKYGLLTAQMAIALDGDDRDDVLVQLLELLAAEKR